MVTLTHMTHRFASEETAVHRKRRLLLVQLASVTAALLFSFSLPAQAQQARGDRLEVVESGFYAARRTGKTEAPRTATGFTSTIADVEFLKDAPAETARIGTAFGVRFRSFGQRRNAKATLRTVWKIPAPGITNPKTGNTYREDVAQFTTTIGTLHVRGYRFSESWEVLRGTWTLEIWQGDRKLLTQSFAIQ